MVGRLCNNSYSLTRLTHSNLDLYTASDHLPKYLLGAKGHSYKVEETAFQEAVGTSKSRWDWLEEKQSVQDLCTTRPGYPGMPGLQKTLDGADATNQDLVPRPEHEVFGLAMLGGGLVFGAAHPYGQFVKKEKEKKYAVLFGC